jgi:hypothetical protein
MALGATERLRILFDVDTQNFKSGVRSLKADLASADGAAGKAKVGFAALGQQLSQYGAQAALAAGAALVAFGAKSVQAFNNAALAADDFANRSGIGVEAASRWIAVGDDFDISAEAIRTSFGRMNLAIEANKFEKYGLDVIRAADGTVDANATFTETVSAIGRIPDATERARVAQEVFGKSWGGISKLMMMDAEDLRQSLDGVSEAQIIDTEEVAKARAQQAAMDNLGEAVQDLMLAIGEGLTPALTTAVEKGVELAEIATDIANSPLFKNTSTIDETNDSIERLADALGLTTEEYLSASGGAEQYGEDLYEAAVRAEYYESRMAQANLETWTADDAMGDAADSADDLGSSMQTARTDAEQYATTMDGLNQRFADAREAIDDLVGEELSKIDAFRAAEDSTKRYADTLLDAEAATRDQADAAIKAAEDMATFEAGAYDTEAGVRAQITALRDMAQALDPNDPLRAELKAYIDQLKGILTEVETDVKFDVDDNSVADAKAKKADIASPVTVPIWLRIQNPTAADEQNIINNRSRSANVDGTESSRPMGQGVFVQNASNAWQAALRIWGALFGGGGKSDTDQMPSQREAFAKELERARRRYEVGDLTAPAYLRVLQRLKEKYKFKRLSAPWMTLWREIKSVKEEIAKANEPDPVDDSGAWDQAAENQAAIEAAQNLRQVASESWAAITDSDPSNNGRALDAWASAIWRDIEASADKRFKNNRGRAWARWARARLEEAMESNSLLRARLRVYLAGIPVFPDTSKGDGDRAEEIGAVGPSAGTGFGGLPGGLPGPVATSRVAPAMPAVHLHFPDALIVDGPGVDKALMKLAPALDRALTTRRRQS